MNEAGPDPETFYREILPRDFNRLLDEQAALGEPGRAVLAGMRAARGTVCVEITGEGGARFALNIEDGRMTPSDTPRQPPFLTLTQDRNAFAQLARASGGSLSALLGALAGLGGAMHLTRKRMVDLEAVDGLIRIDVTGPDGFAVLCHFGTGPRPEQPHAELSLDAVTYAELAGGALDPQSAFLTGRVEVKGDLQKVMQLAFAAVAPD